MKIVSISMVKNESDIIESFVRYNLNIVDQMIILDNCSSDETPHIINKLIKEGLPIVLIKDTDIFYAQNIKTTKLLHKAVKEYEADIVCLLDVDEFIISHNEQNPRKILESIDSSKYHLIKWRTYVPTANDSDDKFIPQRITYIRDETLETYYKVIVPKEIVLKYNVDVSMGNHDLLINGKNNKKLKEYNHDLNIAHFPLRSKEQCMSKILIGWPNTIARNTENESWATHWEMLFNKIKKNNNITSNDLEFFSKNYALENTNYNIRIKKQPINLDFCKNIEIKYETKYNYLNNVLENYISLANEVVSLKKEINLITGNINKIKLIKIKISKLLLR
ncbi:glycosyltransferase family 2 protein [Methanobrevibacter sp.]|uniref:glycosyltransferase family 2 protein n=1 Tax=Methanobrevibacter sp. TaxID=66852 RepID=UPI003869D2C9